MPSTPKVANRRKSADARRAEIVEAASRIAVADGLDRVTAKRVGDAVGVVPGLVQHYFRSADDLVAAAFGHAADTERAQVFGHAENAATPVEQMRLLLTDWLSPDRDAVSLLWLDAWQASRRRPALVEEVTRQMTTDLDRLEPLIRLGAADGTYSVRDSRAAATQIMALVDGLSVQAAIRTTLDYSAVRTMVLRVAEHELGLHPYDLEPLI